MSRNRSPAPRAIHTSGITRVVAELGEKDGKERGADQLEVHGILRRGSHTCGS